MTGNVWSRFGQMVVAALALGVASPAAAVVLKETGFRDNAREAELSLKFTQDPELKYVPMTESRVLILDFVGSDFPTKQQRFAPKGKLVEFLNLVQSEPQKVRLVVKVAPSTVVNVFRHPVEGSTEVRYVVVVEPDQVLAPVPELKPAGPKTVPRILFDPGHGGFDNGALGTITSDKEVALKVALELRKIFEQEKRVEVFFTRTGDYFVPLEKRTDYAHMIQADVFVSLHANMMPRRPWVKGLEVWYLNSQGANKEMNKVLQERGIQPGKKSSRTDQVDHIILSMQQSRALDQSNLLARILNRNLIHTTLQEPRGVKRNNFKVLRPIDVPSALIEFGFLSNRDEERMLADPRYHRLVARAIYDGVLEWMARTSVIKGPAAAGLIKGPLDQPMPQVAQATPAKSNTPSVPQSAQAVATARRRAASGGRAPQAKKPGMR